MAQTITVYDGPMVEWSDSEYVLDTFPRAAVQAEDDEGVLDVLNRALAAVNDGAGSHAPWGRPLALGRPVWLAFVNSADDPAAPKTWQTQQHFFGVTADDHLIVQDWHTLAMTIGDLRRAGESGYLPGDWDHVVVLVPEGLGGGPEIVSGSSTFFKRSGSTQRLVLRRPQRSRWASASGAER